MRTSSNKPGHGSRNGSGRSRRQNIPNRPSSARHSSGGGIPLPGLSQGPLHQSSQSHHASPSNPTHLPQRGGNKVIPSASHFARANGLSDASRLPFTSSGPGRDREEGELEEGELGEDDNAGHDAADASQRVRSSVLLSGQQGTQPAQARNDVEPIATPLDGSLDVHWEMSKQFIEAWNRAGFSFSQLVNEGLDPHILRRIYDEIGINTENTRNGAKPEVKATSPAQVHPAVVVERRPESPRVLSPPTLKIVGDITPSTLLRQDLINSSQEGFKSKIHVPPEANTSKIVQTPSGGQSLELSSLIDNPLLSQSLDKPQPPVADRQDYIARLKAAKLKKPGIQNEKPSVVAIVDMPKTEIVQSLAGTNSQSSSISVVTQPTVSQPVAKEPISGDHASQPLTSEHTEPKDNPASKLAQLRQRALESAKLALAAKAARASTPASSPRATIAKNALANGLVSKAADFLPTGVTLAEHIPQQALSVTTQSLPPIKNNVHEIPQHNQHSISVVTYREAKPRSPQFQPPTPPTASRIPGLFMTIPPPGSATAAITASKLQESASTTPASSTTPIPVQTVTKKRPIASDFDEDSSAPLAKRQFGHPPSHEYHEYHDSVIIEVSDDDSEDDGSENITEISKNNDALQAQNFLDSALSTAAGASSNYVSELGSSAASVQDDSLPRSAAVSDTKLKSRESQIMAMKQKIAEMEQRRKAKAQVSGTTTPVTEKLQLGPTPLAQPSIVSATSTVSKAVAPEILPADVKQSTTQETGSGVAALPPQVSHSSETRRNGSSVKLVSVNGVNGEDDSITVDTTPLGNANKKDGTAALATTSTAGEPARLVIEKQQRSLQLQAGLPILDVTLVRNQGKLASLQAETKEVQSELRREEHEKQNLVREFQVLTGDKSSSPMSDDGLLFTEAGDHHANDGGKMVSSTNASSSETSSPEASPIGVDGSDETDDESEDSYSPSYEQNASSTLPPAAAPALLPHKGEIMDSIESSDTSDSDDSEESEVEYEPPDMTDTTQENQQGKTADVPSDGLALTASGSFRPYVSPLTRFKAYRFHPNFESGVTTGIRSTTYSHSIDIEKPLCVYEAAGGVCNDSACDGQHFKYMILTDHEILRQLGTSIPTALNQIQRQEYVKGLSKIVSDLRSRNVGDGTEIASAILTYRRTFLNDPSRVLDL